MVVSTASLCVLYQGSNGYACHTLTEEPTPTATATETAYLGGRAGLAALLMALPEPAPALALLGAPLPATHRVISYTYP